MFVRIAESAGFCFGVERAVGLAAEAAENRKGPVYTWGPIVHNQDAVSELESCGVRVLNGRTDLEKAEKGCVIIRAHGIPESEETMLRDKGFEVLDATCPFVKKIHRIVQEESEKGRTVLIVGDPEHPEVKGILGWCRGPAFVIENAAQMTELRLPEGCETVLVSQTTANQKNFENVVEKFVDLGYNGTIADTVCNATRVRQQEAAITAAEVDVMLVIGSPDSSNSRKLFDICKKKCNHTYFIQNAAELQREWFNNVRCVGITAGASTPKKIIEEVQKHVRKF